MRASLKTGPAGALAGALLICLVTLGDSTAAYNVCADDNACTHEKMVGYALDLLALGPGSEAEIFRETMKAGAGDEDLFDHIYGIPYHLLLKEAIITMTHFWDADPGDNTPSTYGDFEGPVDIIDTSFIVT